MSLNHHDPKKIFELALDNHKKYKFKKAEKLYKISIAKKKDYLSLANSHILRKNSKFSKLQLKTYIHKV